jgi:prepilin-type N-terminal cleavage/methylation domain-containing protein
MNTLKRAANVGDLVVRRYNFSSPCLMSPNELCFSSWYKSGLTLIEVLVAIAIIGILISTLLPAMQSAREASRRAHCSNNVKQIALAMHHYHDSLQELPPGAISWVGEFVGKRAGPGDWFDDHGWYSQIGPYIEQQTWHDMIDFDVSFSDVTNLAPRRMSIPLYSCPSDGQKRNEWDSPWWARVRGNYVVNFGNTVYGQTEKNGVRFRGAPFSYHRSSRMNQIRDGLSHTLMISECITIDELDRDGGGDWGGPISDMATSLGGQTFQAWLTPNSRELDDVARMCPPMNVWNGLPGCNFIGYDMTQQSLAARSHHAGIVHAARCDGSVGAMADEIDLSAWRALATSKGDEISNRTHY